MIGKLLKGSFKWAQSHHSSFIRSKARGPNLEPRGLDLGHKAPNLNPIAPICCPIALNLDP